MVSLTVQRASPCSHERATNSNRAHHYGKLLGSTFIGIRWDSIDGCALPILALDSEDREGKGAIVAVLCDPEGKGPGYFEYSL